MKAKLNIKRIDSNNLRYELRSGEKGTGKVLHAVNSWDNPRATEQAEEWMDSYIRQNNIEVTPTEYE